MNNEQVGRLAMRVEGTLWVAYYAMPNTMKDALFLGSIRMQFVQDQGRKEAFMAMMRESISDILEAETGASTHWPTPGGVPAPEHEKGGAA